ncbi:hypothetical protein B0J13DRAFT_185051 [Dactylonectria estremocensis]|uniref:Secreted protein n=1 Tax=Dactylonectria estremocensis TaxID=1079267 RepID=A0A9P9JBF4_9HYPO|nr:hypothetical protein B0J13DRAFT_185051 [Dactylonectria estremocensis]
MSFVIFALFAEPIVLTLRSRRLTYCRSRVGGFPEHEWHLTARILVRQSTATVCLQFSPVVAAIAGLLQRGPSNLRGVSLNCRQRNRARGRFEAEKILGVGIDGQPLVACPR